MKTRDKEQRRIDGVKRMKVPRGTKRRQRRENMAAFNAERERRNRTMPEGRIV